MNSTELKTPKLSDSVTTTVSATFISVTVFMIVFLKKYETVNIKFGYFLMIIAIMLFTFSSVVSYADITKACCDIEDEWWLNIKLLAYYLGLYTIGMAAVYILLI